MANNAANVSTGKPKVSGAVYRAPLGTTLPTDATTALSSAFVNLGYVSDAGLSNSNEMDVSTIKAWGGVVVYRSLIELTDEFKFTLIESKNEEVLKAVYGTDNVTALTGGGVQVDVQSENPEEAVWVFELALRDGDARRIVVPDGAITARDEIVYNDSDAIGYGVTVSAYPSATGSTHIEYTEG